MPKNIDDMIVPEKRRSIRDIPIPEGRRRSRYATPPSVPSMTRDGRIQDIRREDSAVPVPNVREAREMRRPRSSRKGVWVASFFALVVLVFAIVSLFNSSTLAYVPKSTALSFNNDLFTARKGGEGEILFSVVKLSSDRVASVPASGEEQVSRRASGTIIVYNSGSADPQRLVENTRFQTSDGLVYRIPQAITIPGRASATQPGSIETVVHADEPGERHNIGLSDFTVPGLAGTPRFTTIYARSKTAMTGGFVGVERAVSDTEAARAKSALELSLREELTALAVAQVPEDFTLVPALSSMEFEDLPQTPSATAGNVNLNLRGNLYGVIFKTSELSTYLAREKTNIAPGETVNIADINSLSFGFVGTVPQDLLAANELIFAVSGDVRAVWRTDEVALKADILGRHKRDVSSILNNYPTIVSATATVRPFWKSAFPEDGGKVVIRRLPAN